MEQQIVSCLGRRLALWTHDAPDHMAAAIRAHRQFYEIDVLMKCRELYLPGTAVIDVGANIGNHTVFFAAILGAPVYAFEPDPANHALLALNIAANGLDILLGGRRFLDAVDRSPFHGRFCRLLAIRKRSGGGGQGQGCFALGLGMAGHN